MKQKVAKILAVFIAINLLFEVMFPTMAYALTGGPSQPEVQSFEPVGTTEMVDVSSGDFVYNIPLLDVDGYPINLSYHSGITMDQEASWVGLGWNINPGVINRNMRGVPDDFKGDQITKDMYMKPNWTAGLNIGATFELFGFDKNILKKKADFDLSVSYGVFYNNYKGCGFEESLTPSITAGQKLKVGGALAISSNTQSGMSIAPSANLSVTVAAKDDSKSGSLKLSVGTSVNSRGGMKSLTFNKGLDFSKNVTTKNKKLDPDGDGKRKAGWEISNGGSSLSYAGQSYVPQINMSMFNVNVSGRFTMGAEFWGGNPNMFISGYYSRQGIDSDKKTVSKQSYGYLYSQEMTGNSDVLHDVNREKDGAYSKHSPALPITTYAYDMYAVSGQGIGGMYRPHRGDVGHVHDDVMVSEGGGGSAGFEIGVGNAVKWGGDVNGNYSRTQTGKWELENGNDVGYIFQFHKKDTANPFYEPVYFKNAGEKTAVDARFIAYKNISKPMRPAFKLAPGDPKELLPETESNKLVMGDGEENHPDPSKITSIHSTDLRTLSKRDKRNENIQYLTYDEINFFLDQGDALGDPIDPQQLVNASSRKGNHIGEITAVNAGGSRYVYGIAAYNTTQEEISFTNLYDPDEATSRCQTGLASYTSDYYDKKRGEDADGYDAYYNATTLPAYAHSYLLTAVLSPDYVDVDRNGPSPDDLGTYTKINYTCKNTNYKWRTPYTKSMYNEGLKSDHFDDKGSIIYGEKEIWHVKSIESRNYIAEFELGERLDGLGVAGVHGGKDTTQKSYYLKTITLYAKKNGVKTLVPIKTVHFEYDYSLCPNVANNIGYSRDKNGNTIADGAGNINHNKGKLTLKRVYFTYGASVKGMFNAYQFNYSDQNPDYDIKGYDRWGNYMPNGACSIELGDDYPTNAEFPYVNQKHADQYSQAWSLDSIQLPSGGAIAVEYEADDYTYVQDKKAMQMCSGSSPGIQITGLGSEQNTSSNQYPQLYDNDHNPYDFIYLHLDSACGSAEEFEQRYMPDQVKWWDKTTYLYFNFYVDITKGKKEYIRGYAEIDNNYRATRINNNTYSLKLKGVHTGDGDNGNPANQIAKAAWQYARMNMPYLVYPGSDMKKDDGGGNNVETVLRSIVGVITDLYEMIDGINDKLLRNNYAKYVDLNKSWIRLANGYGNKKGGGLRVKSITLHDNWNSMGGEEDSEYGQEYDYTTEESGRVISSGVASYEPMIGNEENPFRQPVMYSKENALVPDESFYAEEPFGESFFPSPSVTYSKVTVRNKAHANVTKHATGKVVHEFYTTKDFPTVTDRTNQQAVVEEPNWLTGLFSFKVKNRVTVSQGYQIELNDMNGKPKAELVYAEPMNDETQGRLISGMQYFYRTDPANGKRLYNDDVKVIHTDGSVSRETVGVEADMILDSRENESITISGGIQGNNDVFVLGFFPMAIPIVLPSYSSDQTRFRSVVLTRVVQRYGLLDRTVAYQDNSVITTQNEALDAETGDVLLTKTQNEYHDDIYNLTYPAHWAYEGMEQAYKNIRVHFDNVAYAPLASVPITLPGGRLAKDYFVPGDEVHVSRTGGINALYWVNIKSNGELTLLNYIGNPLPSASDYTVEILRSGRRNLQTSPITIITSKKNPIVGDSINGVDESTDIINAASYAYSDVWRTDCITKCQSDDTECLSSDTISCSSGDLTDYATELIGALNYILTTHQVDTTGPLTGDPAVNTYHELDLTQTGSADYTNSFVYRINQLTGNGSMVADKSRWDISSGNYRLYVKLIGAFGVYVEYPVGSCSSGSQFKIPESVEFMSVDDLHCTERDCASYGLLGFCTHHLEGGCVAKVKFPGGCEVTGSVEFDHIPADEPACSGNYCVSAVPNAVNKYLWGTAGQWRRTTDYLYLESRKQTNNIRIDGTYLTYIPYWKYNHDVQQFTVAGSNKWVWTNQTTKYAPEGMEIENKDTLQRYNSAVFYGTHRLPALVANNAEYREVGFDGFEDYTRINILPCSQRHWNFQNTIAESYSIDGTISHSGKNSLKLLADQTATNEYWIKGCSEASDNTCTDCILPFSPYPNKRYVVSGWTKVNTVNGDMSPRKSRVFVSYKNSSAVDTLIPKGTIIEGWQRFEQIITIPSAAQSVQVKLACALNDSTTWFDDIRIYPFNGNIKSYVYDMDNLRLKAELDENNYATFYEYDEQGALKRVKKETERGVMTVKETRNHMKLSGQ